MMKSINKKNVLVITLIIAALAIIFSSYGLLNNYFALSANNTLLGSEPTFLKEMSNQEETKEKNTIPEFSLEIVAENLFVPWSIVFTSENRILVTERNGSIRVIENGKLQDQPLFRFDEVSSTGEEGLMGLALDPDYNQNKYLYACLAYPKNGELVDKVVRLTDNSSSAEINLTVIDDLPAAKFHAGCELGFGPDDKLYITTGDATTKTIAQQLDSLGGKILRLNTDGSIPEDNPFSNSPVWTLGHRNPQGIAWHPQTEQLFEAEHGPSIFDGPAGGDEVNIIAKSENYGWPVVSHEQTALEFIDPLLVFTPAIAPGSISFYQGDVFPEFNNDLFVAMLKGEGILRIVLDPENPNQVLFYQKLPGIDVGRVREVTVGPDEAIYFTTSNRDGRASTKPNDDKIYRIIR